LFVLSKTSYSSSNVNSCMMFTSSKIVAFLKVILAIPCVVCSWVCTTFSFNLFTLYISFALFYYLWSFYKCVSHDIHSFNFLVIIIQGSMLFFILPFNLTYAFFVSDSLFKSFCMSTHLGTSFNRSQQLMRVKQFALGETICNALTCYW
jgi:hypothetical protein